MPTRHCFEFCGSSKAAAEAAKVKTASRERAKRFMGDNTLNECEILTRMKRDALKVP
jgi:hypothetical protein